MQLVILWMNKYFFYAGEKQQNVLLKYSFPNKLPWKLFEISFSSLFWEEEEEQSEKRPVEVTYYFGSI
jgi:hypothetical protein